MTGGMTQDELRLWYQIQGRTYSQYTREECEFVSKLLRRGLIAVVPHGSQDWTVDLTLAGRTAYRAALYGDEPEPDSASEPEAPPETPAPDSSPTPAGALLGRAAAIVNGARNQAHGDKQPSFEAIASLWSQYLASRQNPLAELRPRDVAWMMVLLKIARSEWGDVANSDHYIDAAGYAAIAGELSLAPSPAPGPAPSSHV